MMNYTAYTAVIFTINHLTAAVAIFLALLSWLLIYAFVLKWITTSRKLGILFGIVVSLVLGALVATTLFDIKPISIEFVSAGQQ